MMKIDVAICKYCNIGVFVRAPGDVRQCECGNVEMSAEGVLVRQGVDSYKAEYDVPFKKTEAELEADFDECRDKFGPSYAREPRKFREMYPDDLLLTEQNRLIDEWKANTMGAWA